MEPEAVTTVDPVPAAPPGSPPRPPRPVEEPPILRRRERAKPKHEKPAGRQDDTLDDTIPGDTGSGDTTQRIQAPGRRARGGRAPKKVRAGRGRRAKGRGGRKGRVEARRVQRIVRHVDPWSVLKFSLLLYFSVFLIVLSAGVLLWLAASATDVIGGVENFIEELFGFDTFAFEPGQILTASVLGGLVLVVAGTAANVVFAVLFNLISDVVGGLRLTVIEEETVRRVRREEAS